MAEEIQEEIEVQSPGAMLKARRESLQLSIEEIAEKLHLRPAVVIGLEEDVIDHSVSMTFTKGYVRLYARHMEMDPAPVLAAFDELANPIKQPAKLQSFSQRVAKQASDTRLMMLSYFILFAIIAMAVIWWFQQPDESLSDTGAVMPDSSQSGSSQKSQEMSSEARLVETMPAVAIEPETQVLSDNSISEPAVEASSDSTPDGNLQAGDTAQGSPDAIADDAEVLVTEAPQESLFEQTSPADPDNLQLENNDVARELAQQAGSSLAPSLQDNDKQSNDSDNASPSENIDSRVVDNSDFPESFNSAEPITQELVFTFEQDCWMNLTDATGENIAYGVKNAGRVMPVSGIPPFEVVLGAPQGVAITVNGAPFDMSAFPAGRTARFTIGSQSENEENFDREANSEIAESGESPE